MVSRLIISFLEMIPTWIMLLPIFLCSIAGLAVIIERLLYYHMLNQDYRAMITDVRHGTKESVNGKGPVAKIIQEYLGSSGSSRLKLALIERFSGAAIHDIERYSGVMSTIATISPMFGLLGTVTGMMKSFGALAVAGPASNELLAYGIAEALITTALGLVVAIPALIFYNYMVSKNMYYIKEIEYVANQLAEHEEHEAVQV